MAKREVTERGQPSDFNIDLDGSLYFHDRLCVLGDLQLK